VDPIAPGRAPGGTARPAWDRPACGYRPGAATGGRAGHPDLPGHPDFPHLPELPDLPVPGDLLERHRLRLARPVPGRPGRTARRPAGRSGVHLTRRGRMVVSVLLVMATLLVTALVWLAAAGRAQATGSGPAPASVYRNLTAVVVHPGQSLWSIASEADPSADPRTVMQEIVDLNALHGTNLVPGQRLWVPQG